MKQSESERRVVRNFLTLGSGEALARLIAFAATVYLARTLGPASYGVVGFAFAVYLYLVRVADCGLEAGLGVREIAVDRSKLSEIGPSLVTIRFLVSAALAILIAVISLVALPEPDATVLALWALPLLAVGVNTRWIHLGLEKTRFASFARAGGELIMVITVLVLVTDAGDVARVPFAQFLGDAAAALLLAWWLRRQGIQLSLGVHVKRVAPYLSRSLPLIWSGLLGLVIYNSDLLFLRLFSGSAAVGYYVAAYALVSFLINLGTAYNQSLLPTLTRLGSSDTDAERSLYSTASAQVFAVTLPAAVGGSLLAPEIIDFVFGAGYATSAAALQILMWSVPLLLVRGVPVVALLSRKKEDLVLRINLWATAANLSLNLILIPRYGVIGAAWATVVTELVRFALAFAFARDEGYPAMGFRRYWRSFVAAGGLAAFLVLARPEHLIVSVSVGAVVYFVGLVLTGGIRLNEKRIPALRV